MTWCGFYLQIGNMTCGVCRKIRSIEEGFAHALLSIALLLFRAQSGTKPELHSRLRTGPLAKAARYRMPAWVQRQQQSKGLDTEKSQGNLCCVKFDRPMATPLKHDWNTRIKTMYNIIFGIYIYIYLSIYLSITPFSPALHKISRFGSQFLNVWLGTQHFHQLIIHG